MADRFRTQRSFGLNRVDRRQGIIYGASLMQAGDINDDRPWTVDGQTLDQLVELGSQSNKGVKARFTHPSMSSDGLGKYLGQWHNLRRDGDTVRGDLHLSSTAYETPDGDLATYVLDMAEEHADMFGNSVVVSLDRTGLDELPEGARAPMRLLRLHAADVVDEPAATRGGFFSVDSQAPAAIPAIVSRLIEDHFSTAEPEELLERFAGLLSKHFGREIPMANDKQQVAAPVATDSDTLSRTEAARFVEHFGDQGARWFLEGKSFEDACLSRIDALIEERDEALSHVETLQERLGAALDAAGEPEPLEASEDVDRSAEDVAMEQRYQELRRSGLTEQQARRAAAMRIKG